MSHFEIRANPMLGDYALSLYTVVHNEMYFLPEFLRHYRALGVERFIILDDASTDGTTAFLAAQPDCMTLGSAYRFADEIDGRAAIFTWRQALLDEFCLGQWTIIADADEFLALPTRVTIWDVIRKLEAAGSASVWGVMIDLYPARVEQGGAFAVDGPWYFDARPHLRVRPGHRKPATLYRGVRARLFGEHRVIEPGKSRLHRAAFALRLGRFIIKPNSLSKVPLVRWTPAHRINGQHRVTPPPSVDDILPLMHFKFVGDLSSKFAYALEAKDYPSRSRHYQQMSELLTKMLARDRGFLGPRSRRLASMDDFYETGVGKWSPAPR